MQIYLQKTHKKRARFSTNPLKRKTLFINNTIEKNASRILCVYVVIRLILFVHHDFIPSAMNGYDMYAWVINDVAQVVNIDG